MDKTDLKLLERSFQAPSDVQLVLDFVKAVRPPEYITDYPSPADLQELLNLPDVQAHTRLWLDSEGQIAGYAMVDYVDHIQFESSPQAGAALDEEMLAWGCAEARQTVIERQSEDPPAAGCRADQLERIALLERYGFEREADWTVHMARSLSEPVPDPVLPPGFSIRPYAGEAEIEDWVALHRAAFGTEFMTVEYRRAMSDAPDYDPTLDLLAAAPDGRLAAYSMGAIRDSENAISGRKDGYADPVATHPDFQRQGLARALICAVLRLLQQRGMETARMGTDSANLAMQRAAAAVGFQVDGETLRFALKDPLP